MAVTKHWCQNIHVSCVSGDSSRGPQIFQKFKKFWKILGTRRVTQSKFHTERLTNIKYCCTKLIPLYRLALGFVPFWSMIWILKSLLKFVHVAKTRNMLLQCVVW